MERAVVTGERQSRKPLWWGLALSALLHAILIPLASQVQEQPSGVAPEGRDKVRMMFLDQAPPEKRSAAAGEGEERIAEPAPEQEIQDFPDEIPGTEVPAGQIVLVIPPECEEMPDHARYAGMYAVKVEEEVRAARPTRGAVPERLRRVDARAKVPAAGPDAKGGAAAAGDGYAAGPGNAAGGNRPGGEGGLPSGSDADGTGDGLAFGPHMEGVDPVSKYSPSSGPFASDDYVSDVDKEGDSNLLNTVPFKFAGFFERVKERVKEQWDPNRVYQLRDPTGQLYGHKDRLTVLHITLDSGGNVLETNLETKSGLKFLDDEAVRAFWAAGPFVNPPRGLLDADGKIKFDFGFALLVASSRFQFFWRFE